MRDSKRDTDVKNRLSDSVGEGEVGWFERIALKHVYYHMWNRSPVQVRCMRQGAQGWCTGMTLGDGMGRRWERGSGWGTQVHPWLIHVNLWQKPPQYCKVIGLQLKFKKLTVRNIQKKKILKIWKNSWLTVLYYFQVYSKVIQFLDFFSIAGFYEILNIVPCAIQRVLVYFI